MISPEYFKDFHVFYVERKTKSKHKHFCCMCGAELGKRKVKLYGEPANDPKKVYACKSYFFCPNNECWGRAKKIIDDSGGDTNRAN